MGINKPGWGWSVFWYSLSPCVFSPSLNKREGYFLLRSVRCMLQTLLNSGFYRSYLHKSLVSAALCRPFHVRGALASLCQGQPLQQAIINELIVIQRFIPALISPARSGSRAPGLWVFSVPLAQCAGRAKWDFWSIPWKLCTLVGSGAALPLGSVPGEGRGDVGAELSAWKIPALQRQ